VKVVACDGRADAVADVPGVELRAGSHDLAGCADVVLSPSFNPDWPENRTAPHLKSWWEARRAGLVRFHSEVELAALARDLPWITIGGTDGKSTTAALTHHLARVLIGPALLGGNSWTAISDVIQTASDARLAVVEVSAFQLWEGHALCPSVVVLTNIAEDHLDHYGSMDDYVQAKLQILRHLGPDNSAVLSGSDARLLQQAPILAARGVKVALFGDSEPSPSTGVVLRAWHDGAMLKWRDRSGELAVARHALAGPGPHNARNALAAVAALCLCENRGVAELDESAVTDALKSFRGLPHRVELVGERGAARWYNDSKATNVHAAVAGLSGMRPGCVVIAGGVDKGLQLGTLVDAWRLLDAQVIAIGEIAERLIAEAGEGVSVRRSESMESAVALALELSGDERDVILSPGCSSFDMFRSFEHRGDEFRRLVSELSA
jgi:UDP-N-acetylmuramoylalanine--D-glutamate ligase